jgi:aarF domain-containing kinase
MTLGYIHDHLRQEVDFLNEGKNAEKAFKFIQEDGFLKENIYVPKVCWRFL